MAKTAAWWDTDNCKLPDGFDLHRLVGNIRNSLSEMSYRGPLCINAVGNMERIDHSTMVALSATGKKESAHKKIMVDDMLCFGMDNTQRCNIMLLSDDRDYFDALHQLRCRCFSILLAQAQDLASIPLIHVASTVWIWNSLICWGRHLTKSQVEDFLANSKK